MNAASIDDDRLRVNFKRRILRLLGFQCCELELVWVALLVKGLVLRDADVKSIVVSFVQVSLVEDLPVDLEGANTGILDLESLANGWNKALGGGISGASRRCGVCDDSRHG